MNTKQKIFSLTALLLAGCASSQQGSCPLVRNGNAADMGSVLDSESKSGYDSDSSSLQSLEEISRSAVQIKSTVLFEEKVNGETVTKEAEWTGAGTALINPEKNEEYVLTALEVVIPYFDFETNKKLLSQEKTVNGFKFDLAGYDSYYGLALLKLKSCPESNGCPQPYRGKISRDPGVGDYFLGFSFRSGSKEQFSGRVEGLEKLIGLLPTKARASISSGQLDFGSGVFVFEMGKPYFTGVVLRGNSYHLEITPASGLYNFLEKQELGKFYLQDK